MATKSEQNKRAARKYYYRNREQVLAKKRMKYQQNRKEYLKKQKAYREANPEKYEEWRLNHARNIIKRAEEQRDEGNEQA